MKQREEMELTEERCTVENDLIVIKCAMVFNALCLAVLTGLRLSLG